MKTKSKFAKAETGYKKKKRDLISFQFAKTRTTWHKIKNNGFISILRKWNLFLKNGWNVLAFRRRLRADFITWILWKISQLFSALLKLKFSLFDFCFWEIFLASSYSSWELRDTWNDELRGTWRNQKGFRQAVVSLNLFQTAI